MPWCWWCKRVSGVTRVGVTGAATEGVTPNFFCKKLTTFLVTISHFFSVTPVYFPPPKLVTFFVHHMTFLDFTRVSPPGGCHPVPLLPVRPYLSTILCKFAHENNFSLGCHPWRVSSGAVRPPLSSDATETSFSTAPKCHCCAAK